MTRIVALGAGRMGRGIGHVFAYAGYRVDILDFKARTAEEGAQLRAAVTDEIGANLALLRDLGVLDEGERRAVLGRIRVHALQDAPSVLGAADVVFEGVTETLEAKRDAFARACVHLRPDAIVASTTSSMLADALAALVTHPGRFLNAHFLNPAYLIPLVEVSPAQATDERTFAALRSLLESAGKVVVRCAPSPGWESSTPPTATSSPGGRSSSTSKGGRTSCSPSIAPGRAARPRSRRSRTSWRAASSCDCTRGARSTAGYSRRSRRRRGCCCPARREPSPR